MSVDIDKIAKGPFPRDMVTEGVGIVRDKHLNASDAMTFKDLATNEFDAALCGTEDAVWLKDTKIPVHVYETVEELAGYRLLDVADFMYEWSQELTRLHPNVVATIWENIPYNFWGPGPSEMIGKVKGFIARSQMARRTLQLYGIDDEKIAVIPAAVDTDLFKPNRDGKQGEKVVLFAGRLVWEKGLTDLFWACVGQGWTLRIGGEGPIGEWMSAMAAQHDIRLELVGKVEHHKMPEFLNSGDVFVYPSYPTPGWIEQFGIGVIEAMACGLPVITSDGGAFDEIAPVVLSRTLPNEEWNPRVPAGRWDLLREKIAFVIDHPEAMRVVRQWNLRAVEYTFSSEVVGERLREFYGRYL